MKYISKFIRIITVAPVIALLLLTALFAARGAEFGGVRDYVLSIVWLTVFPLLAYPLQPVIPMYKGKGREGQRNFAIVMAVTGYVCSIISGLVFRISPMLWIVYLTYFISGVLTALLNKVLHVRSSGHACGVVGPIAVAVYFLGYWGLLGCVLPAFVYWSSIKLKRHTPWELLWGSLVPVCALFIAQIIV